MDIGVRAHCRRVATWSRELAGALGLSESERTLVERAALSHHVPEIVLDDHARIHLLADIGLEESGDQSLLDEDARLILSMFRGRREVSDPSIAKLIAVLEMSDDFDQFFEAEPLFESEVVKKVSDPEVSVDELESVASLDPVLTGRLIQTANSAYYSPARPIGSIQHAIAYIGVDVTRKVLLASTIRGNFASMRLHQLWNHSLDVAQAAEELTRHSATKMDPSEAFLAGLVHDIGRLAFSIMPARYLERFYRLTDGGCPPVQIELCLSGRSHAEVGAETLVQWKFPEWAVEAIRCHHSPERSSSPLASLLYIAEFVADSDEDLPSFTRLKSACRLAGIDADAIAQIDGKDRDILDGLRFAA
jgi:putative nucleotidyltransferase with HDIG domain